MLATLNIKKKGTGTTTWKFYSIDHEVEPSAFQTEGCDKQPFCQSPVPDSNDKYKNTGNANENDRSNGRDQHCNPRWMPFIVIFAIVTAWGRR